MAVYVDMAANAYGRMIMCHMLADTIGELLAMADNIGIARRHFQPMSHPHFDVSKGYRSKAVALGAVEIDRKTLVQHMKTQRLVLKSNRHEMEAFEAALAQSTKGKIILQARQRNAGKLLQG